MNPLLQRLMKEAARLTRSGNLQAATDAIQRSLSAHLPGAQPPAPPFAPMATPRNSRRPAQGPDADNTVLDGYTRFVDEAAGTRPAAQADVDKPTPAAATAAPERVEPRFDAHFDAPDAPPAATPPVQSAASPSTSRKPALNIDKTVLDVSTRFLDEYVKAKPGADGQVDPADPIGHIEPVNGGNAGNPLKAVNPINPINPIDPINPIKPHAAKAAEPAHFEAPVDAPEASPAPGAASPATKVEVADAVPVTAKAPEAFVPPAPVKAPVAARPRFPAQPEQWTAGSHANASRTLAYKLYLPPREAADTQVALPLILMLHGCTQNPNDFAAGTQMNALARKHGFAVIYPEQTQHANSHKCWNWFKTQHQQRGRGEPALLAELTQAVMSEHPIDPSRVYVAGLSAGGAMADIMARCYPDIFAAVGVHSGLPTGAAADVMSALSVMRNGTPAIRFGGNPRPMPPTIVFHGDADTTVHPRNGAAVVSAARGSQSAASGSRTTTGQSAKGQGFTRTEFPPAAGHSAVEEWVLHGAGHAWSGGSASGSYTNPAGADASAEMLRFFMAHPMGDGSALAS